MIRIENVLLRPIDKTLNIHNFFSLIIKRE